MYDPVAYWSERGATYEAAFNPAAYLAQEAALERVLGGLAFRSVLEVGCGFGRIGELIRRIRPAAEYSAIDLSPAMVAAARRRLPTADIAVSSIVDFAPDRRWDLVLAVEVLMHIPPADVAAAARRLVELARYHVVTVDWTERRQREPMAHNFRHDYTALLAVAGRGPERIPIGLQTIHVVTA